MAIALLDLNPIIERIHENVDSFRSVDGAVDFESVLANGFKNGPVAYVLPERDNASNNRLDNGVMQLNSSRFGVVIGVHNVKDSTGKAAHDELKTLRELVMQQLLNWKPGSNFKPITFSHGRLTLIRDRVLWWADVYQTASHIRMI